MRSNHYSRSSLAVTVTISALFALTVPSLTVPSLTPAASAAEAPTIRSAAGPLAADITDVVNSFRADLGGGTTPAANGSFGGLRREINWDGVPDQFASPNDFPADFFNTRSPRGVVFSTPGLNFQVSSNAASRTPVRFGNINPIYVRDFGVFSPERLFSAISSTETDVKFFLPGTKTPAVVRGFGSVFSDVDSPKSTFMKFYDATDSLIATIPVPAEPGNGSLSFAGATLPGEARIARVRIVSGGQTLSNGTDDTAQPSRDKVAMDDFIYSEPTAILAATSTTAVAPTTAAAPTTLATPPATSPTTQPAKKSGSQRAKKSKK